MRTLVAAAVLFSSTLCIGQNMLKILPAPLEAGSTRTRGDLHFFCTADYDRRQCAKDSEALRKALVRLPTERLGEWTFVIAASAHWEEMLRRLGGHAGTPAFSLLDVRATVMEEALFSGSLERQMQVRKSFGETGEGLLNLAITHEMGHAVCGDANERSAEEFGRELRERKEAACAVVKAKK